MSEQLPGHVVQALVQTGNMASEREMNGTVARIVRIAIFPKAPFAADSDFTTDGKIFKACSREYKKGGGNKDHFRIHWQMKDGWKVARSTINSKRNSVQDSVRKHTKKCKQGVTVSLLNC
jgi:hypothetical protein